MMRSPLRYTFRQSRFVMATLVASLMAGAPVAEAAVNTAGDVPQASTGFGSPPPTVTPANDLNGDNIADTIDDQGNNVFDFLADPDDPNPPNDDNGLDWRDPLIWVDYETPQNLLVGETSSGTLEINGGSALRYQHLVLGGAGGTSLDGTVRYADAELELHTVVGGGTENFDFEGQLQNADDLPTTGVGIMTVTGFGSTFNNAPAVVPGEFRTALDFASYTGPTITPDDSSRDDLGGGELDGGYDVHVGLIGTGVLNVEAGGSVQIQDALFVGLGESASGTVTVDGSGSSLIAYGRNGFNSGGESEGTNAFGSIIGGHGSGSLNITAGGRVDMFNGASIGHANGNQNLGDVNDTTEGTGTGYVTLEGNGSTWNVYVSQAVQDVVSGDIALAVGELRDRTAGIPTNTLGGGSRLLGSGTLQIGAGSQVNVTQTESYNSTDSTQAKMIVGYNGRVIMQGGNLDVGDALINDGSFEGYGQISAGSLTNTTLGTIDAGGSTTISTERFDLQVAGQMNNDGTIRGNGNLSSGTFYNGSLGNVVVESGELLAIRSTAVDSNIRNPNSPGPDQFAYSEFDDDNINGQYQIQADLNDDGVVDNNAARFYQANMGSIRVEGGELELGRADVSSPLALVNRENAFVNGRYVEFDDSNPFVYQPRAGVITGEGSRVTNDVVGTIVSNGGTLNFRSGLYNTGVVAFTGGDNTVVGRVLNDSFDYDSATDTGVDNPSTPQDPDVVNGRLVIPGTILVSGDNTTVTFTDTVENAGTIAIAPNGSVINFLDNLFIAGGEIDVTSGSGDPSASIIVVGGLYIETGTLTFQTLQAPSVGDTFGIISAGNLSAESRFTNLDLPALGTDEYWNVIYDTGLNEIRAEVISIMALGGDFNGDGVVDLDDLAIWESNVGIVFGASIIQGDADLDGDVDLDDYLLISQQIAGGGTPVAPSFAVASSTTIASATAIPEPTTSLLALLACAGIVGKRSRR